ncbi:unnamed protein product [Symbiodinium sp. CCMP2592]|nr:unnamed protein product [Symbiodinium sp. CCMP2592]
MRERLRQNNAELKNEITHAVGQRVEVVEKTVTSQLMDTLATQDEPEGRSRSCRPTTPTSPPASGRSSNGPRGWDPPGAPRWPNVADESERRRPAMVMGGWDEDQAAETTLARAKQMIADLRVDLDMTEAFCPGVRRGFVIIPYKQRGDETEQGLRDRLRGATQRVQDTNIELGRRGDGQIQRLKAPMVASKTKRLLLESGADKSDIDTEWFSGTLWHKSVRMCSAVTAAPMGATTAGTLGAWIHLGQAARQLGMTEEELVGRWQPLGAFHDGSQTGHQLHVATWNVGGLDIQRCSDLLGEMLKHDTLSCTSLLLLQEIVVPEPGIQFHVAKDWKIVYGRADADWRGEGVAYLAKLGGHEHSGHIAGGIYTVLKHPDGRRTGLISMLRAWGETHPMSIQHLIIGVDANESLHYVAERLTADTGQGNALLHWMMEQNLYLPEQNLAAPSHYPYNTAFQPRRLDYILVRHIRAGAGQVVPACDMATTDHEPVLVVLLEACRAGQQACAEAKRGPKQLLERKAHTAQLAE